MSNSILLISIVPAVTLLAVPAILPRSFADLSARAVRQWVTGIAAIQFVFASALVVSFALRLFAVSAASPAPRVALPTEQFQASLIYFDGVSTLMFWMVSFIGWVICRYSIRYLDGDASQGRYFCWTGFTLGAVSMMVVSGHLLLFFSAWVLTSVGLHQLLLHNPTRPVARRCAWTKLITMRLSDAALGIAFIVLYREFGTAQFSDLFIAAKGVATASIDLQFASFLLVMAAVIKSAQVPFHTWLPQTLDTPTPVSALMHAGIVNAGGYLIIRTSPIVSTTPWTLAVLAIIGTVTTCYAAVVMLTQTSVKKSLAYSTIAQMGFMMLQCGLGAFSAALLHILVHSMYKAHAFLGSGTVIVERRRIGTGSRTADESGLPRTGGTRQAISGITAAAVTIGFLALAALALGMNPATKPGGFVLAALLCLAIARWLDQVYATGDGRLALRGTAIAGALCFIYVISYRIVDGLAGASVPEATIPTVQWAAVGLIIACGFGAMFWIERAKTRCGSSDRTHRWFIHASNGFYVEAVIRRVFGSLFSS